MTALALVVLLAGAGGCDSGGGGARKPRAPVTPPATVRAAPPRSFLEKLIPPPGGILPAARVPGQIRRLVAALPVERKVAQLLLVGFDGRDPSAPFFSTLQGTDVGGVVVEQRNYSGAATLGSLTAAIQAATAGRSHEAPLILAPQEGGQNSAFPDLPPKTAPGDLSGVLAAASDAARAARTLKGLGFNGVLAPDADVGASSGADPLGTRAYASDPRQVSAYVAAVVAAYRR